MVFGLDGNQEIGEIAHVRSRESFFSSPKMPISLHACATCSELPFNIITMEKGDIHDIFINVQSVNRFDLSILTVHDHQIFVKLSLTLFDTSQSTFVLER